MRLIDVMHLGRPRVIGCWHIGDVLVDPGPSSCLEALLSGLGEERPRAILVTHIHLDHAGATGSLVRRWPDLEVYVHERGAPHLIDPARLLESARRLYGENMGPWWGEVAPVPEANVTPLLGGERLLDGRFEVAYTPGHASHHVAYLHDRTAFVGDVGGARIEAGGLTILPAPPPDIDVEAWHESLDRVRAWRPRRLAITHFGAHEDVEAQLDAAASWLDEWAERARDEDRATFVADLNAQIEADSDPELRAAYAMAAPPELSYAGLERYWRKRAEAVPPPAAPPVS
jgi:glyoxylase-like metal-dependent hydrolase (beta-lactamase superfamily II)